jgi:hypothetical protein
MLQIIRLSSTVPLQAVPAQRIVELRQYSHCVVGGMMV